VRRTRIKTRHYVMGSFMNHNGHTAHARRQTNVTATRTAVIRSITLGSRKLHTTNINTIQTTAAIHQITTHIIITLKTNRITIRQSIQSAPSVNTTALIITRHDKSIPHIITPITARFKRPVF